MSLSESVLIDQPQHEFILQFKSEILDLKRPSLRIEPYRLVMNFSTFVDKLTNIVSTCFDRVCRESERKLKPSVVFGNPEH
jgi:hypothetical protein